MVNSSRKGIIERGLKQIITEVHRLEANIQPQNTKSVNLIKKLGFRNEGYSPRYLYLNNQWCDHERWAITSEEWKF